MEWAQITFGIDLYKLCVHPIERCSDICPMVPLNVHYRFINFYRIRAKREVGIYPLEMVPLNARYRSINFYRVTTQQKDNTVLLEWMPKMF